MKKILLVLGCLLFLSMLMAVSAVTVQDGVTIIKPTAGAYSQNITLQVSNVTSLFNTIENCTFYIKSAGLTANTSWVNMGTFLNTTVRYVNGTYNSTYLEDGTDYTLNATCRNQSNDIAYSTVLLTVDNTIPVAPVLTPANATAITSAQTYTFSGAVTDSKTTACTYTIIRGGATSDDTTNYNSGTGTYSTTTCTFTKEFSQGNTGTWIWSLTASDGTNSTTSYGSFINNIPTGGNVDLPGTPTTDDQATCTSLGSNYIWSGGVCYQVNTNTQNTTDYSWIWWIVGIVFIIAIIYFIVKK